MLYTKNEGRTTKLLHENMYVFLLFQKASNLRSVRETDGGEPKQAALLTHTFFFS